MKYADLNLAVNVNILVYERRDGVLHLVDRRDTHNVLTNTGRAWLMQRLGSSDYGNPTPPSHTSAVIAKIGLGVGGALQDNPAFLHTQVEIPSVIALEDPVAFYDVGATTKAYLRTVANQSTVSTDDFPAFNRTVFTLDVLESEISYAGATSFASNVTLNTLVPVSELGLYLSTAVSEYDSTDNPPAGVPTEANDLVCYNIFAPIPVTPNTMLRIQWELRC